MEGEDLLVEPSSEYLSPESPIGRVMNTLLSSRSRHLEAAISRVGVAPSKSSSGALLDESLCFLWRHVEEAVKKEEPLDEILVPMIQHSLMFARHKKSMPNAVLLRWLISNDMLSHALISQLVVLIRKKRDHYVALGWCLLVGKLIEDIVMQSLEKGEHPKKVAMLITFGQSIPILTSIICTASKQSGGFELPTRLSIAAADCVLILTEALAKGSAASDVEYHGDSTNPATTNYQMVSVFNNISEEKTSHQSCYHLLSNMNSEEALWVHLDCLITIVQKLQAWSKKSQPLHARGLGQVWRWLHEIKVYYTPPIPSTGNNLLRDGIILLCSCWKQYASLLKFDATGFAQNHKEMLVQFMSAIQFYTKKPIATSGNSDVNVKTRIFFLNCIALLWGRLQGKYLEIALAEYGHELLRLLFDQLHCDDEYLIEIAVSILRGIIFVSSSSDANACLDASRMESVLPLLLDILDERDSTSRAITQLTAECCYVYPEGPGLEELFRRLKEGNHQQKKNVIDIILELLRLDSGNALPAALRLNISKCMLDCVADKELAHCIEVTELFPQLDYSTVFPALVHLVYSKEEKVSSTASKALIVMLQSQSDNFDVLRMILDSLSDLNKMPLQVSSKSSSVFLTKCKWDVDCIFRLILRKDTIKNWRHLIGKLIQKMFAEPSNTVIVRFMSNINEHLAENIDIVFSSLLSYFQRQLDFDQINLSDNQDASSTIKDILKSEDTLFSRICPLLLIRVLPLKVFDDLQTREMYGDLDIGDKRSHCIASYLVNRAFSLHEYDDVHKLAAELCGRLHPEVLFPLVVDRLNHALDIQDVLTIKTCLFTICTSIVARGSNHSAQKGLAQIRNAVYIVLSWPSIDSNEVSKAQHGCIDCLALMICNEMQVLATSNYSQSSSVLAKRKVADNENLKFVNDKIDSVLVDVIQKLTRDATNQKLHEDVATPVRICMANVLISVCQKLPDSEKREFACRTIPILVSKLQDIVVSDVRAACLQVLFSAVYHLKSSVLPFASDLLKLSITALKDGSEKEKLSAAKLMGALMASQDEIILAISPGLLEVRAVLVHNASVAATSELRELCRQLLSCITST